MAIFKAYDIRGKYPKEIDENLYYKIGNSVKKFEGVKKVVVGMDMRDSSPSLKDSFVKGLRDSGINVIDIDLASTPMVYQASHDLDVDMGFVITASHNSKEFNGMKICKKNAYPVGWDNGISMLKDSCENFEEFICDNRGEVTKILNYKDKYKETINSFVDFNRKLKVVIDCGNGMAGLVDNEILKKHLDIIELYPELDGNFPNHEANPLKEETLEDLKKKVVETKADLGFAFDGDADRIGFVDEKGNFIPADIVCAYFIDNFISKFPQEQNYASDVRSTKIIKELVESHNKTFFPSRIGHTLVKKMMIENNIFFSGELSGHFYFKFSDNTRYDSAIRAGIEFINFLSKQDKPFSEIATKYKKYFHSPEINFEISDKEGKINEIETEFTDAKIDKTDGITIDYGDWWFNVRASNTEDILRLNFEAKTEDLYNQKIGEIKFFLNK